MTKARDIASASPAPSTVSATEIGYLDGVTSAIQTQIDSKIGSASAISPTLIDAKGDLIVGSAADTAARLAVGTNDYVLTADSSATNGVKWAAPAGGGANWSLLNTGGTALTGANTITVSGISSKDKIMVLLTGVSGTVAYAYVSLRFNSDTGSNYIQVGSYISVASTYAPGNFGAGDSTGTSVNLFALSGAGTSLTGAGYLMMTGANASGLKSFTLAGSGSGNASNNTQQMNNYGGFYTGTSTISSVSAIIDTGNFDAGSIYVYTSA